MSKINSNCEKQIIFLIISYKDKEHWNYLSVNKLSTQVEVHKNKDFYGILLPFQKDNILKFHQYIKSERMSCIIHGDLESLIKKIDACTNNPKNSSATKVDEHIPCRF